MKDFVWNSPDWWAWFTAHRRRPSINALLKLIISHDAFIVFHGCRPRDVASYYSDGLRSSDLDELNRIAREVFLSPHVPPITEQALTAAITSISRLDHGKLYVVVDDRELIRYCGHYMIYGSEHLCGIGASLTREHGFDYRQVLKCYGIPTVVRIRLPLSHIPPNQLRDLARYLHEATWEDDRHRTEPSLFNWAFILHQPIPPEQIIGHVHPEVIPDPLHQNLPYRYREESA